MSQPHNHCVIELRGSPKVCWVDYLQDVLVYEQIEDGTVRSTALVWQPVDLPAFLGMLQLLVDRDFPVLTVKYQQAAPGAARIEPWRLQSTLG